MSYGPETTDLRECVEGWKAWHDEISAVLGCKWRERNVTMEAAKKLAAPDPVSEAAGRLAEASDAWCQWQEIVSDMSFLEWDDAETITALIEAWGKEALAAYRAAKGATSSALPSGGD